MIRTSRPSWARAGWRLAVMVSNSRSVPEGIGLIAQPIAIQQRLAQQHPDRSEYRSDLARSYNNLGIMHRSNNQRDLGAEDWNRALALREELAREHPDDFLARRDLAQSLQNMGNWYREERGQADRAEEVYRRALAIQESLVREVSGCRPAPDRPSTRALRPRSRPHPLRPCVHSLQPGGPLPGRGQVRRSSRGSAASARTPGRGWFESSRAGPAIGTSWPRPTYELGRLHQVDGQITRAAAAWNRSRELLQFLVREHPADSNYRYNLALTLRSLSIASDAIGQPAEAEETRRSAREVEEPLIREHPETNAYYFDAAQIYTSCSTTVVPNASGSVDRRTFAESCSALAIGYAGGSRESPAISAARRVSSS